LGVERQPFENASFEIAVQKSWSVRTQESIFKRMITKLSERESYLRKEPGFFEHNSSANSQDSETNRKRRGKTDCQEIERKAGIEREMN
jgi:hypothetical protein